MSDNEAVSRRNLRSRSFTRYVNIYIYLCTQNIYLYIFVNVYLEYTFYFYSLSTFYVLVINAS